MTKNRQLLRENLSARCVFPIDDSARVQSFFSMQKPASGIWDLDQLTIVNLITLKNTQKSMFSASRLALGERV